MIIIRSDNDFKFAYHHDQIVAIDPAENVQFSNYSGASLTWNFPLFCEWIDRSNFAKIIASSALYITRKDVDLFNGVLPHA